MKFDKLINKIIFLKKTNVKQLDISKKLNITESKISRIIKGKQTPNLKDLELFANYFNCSINDLIEIEKIDL